MTDVRHIGQSMSRLRLMIGRRLMGRLAIRNIAPSLELSHLDVLEAIRRTGAGSEVTVGSIAETLRVDPSRASRMVTEMVDRNVLCRKASQGDARRTVVLLTPLGGELLSELQAQKLSIIAEIVADWPVGDVDAFAALFERFIDGYEKVLLSQHNEAV